MQAWFKEASTIEGNGVMEGFEIFDKMTLLHVIEIVMIGIAIMIPYIWLERRTKVRKVMLSLELLGQIQKDEKLSKLLIDLKKDYYIRRSDRIKKNNVDIEDLLNKYAHIANLEKKCVLDFDSIYEIHEDNLYFIIDNPDVEQFFNKKRTMSFYKNLDKFFEKSKDRIKKDNTRQN